jgi:hypothetical protein
MIIDVFGQPIYPQIVFVHFIFWLAVTLKVFAFLCNVLVQAVDREFLLRMSYMEIYNEDINDLLAPEQAKLQVHENLEV